MDFFRKNKFLVCAVFLLLFAYLLSRLYNLTNLPIFTDEAIYIRWSQIAGSDSNWRFISLTDGKQPMLVWIAMILLRFIKDPLMAGRLVSVISGFFSAIGIFLLSYEIFKNKLEKPFKPIHVAIVVTSIYVLYPFALVYDRMALYDSLVSMFIIWSLYFEVLLARYVRLDIGLILGMIIGGGMLTKTNASFAIILLPFSLLLFNFKEKNYKKRLIQFGLYALVAVVISMVMYSVLRLSPFFHIISQKNYTFIYTPQEILNDPFRNLLGNIRGMSTWLAGYITIPFLILIASAFFVGKKHVKENIFLLTWFIIPFLSLALFGRTIYPRFILFMTMPLLVIGGYALYHMIKIPKRKLIKFLTVVVFLLAFVVNDLFIVTDFAKASIPQGDREQFITAWPAGVGVKETIDFLREKSKKEKIYVGTEGTFGLMPYALEIYLKDNKNIKTQGFWPIGDTPPKEVLDNAKQMQTYFVFYQPCPSCPSTGVAPASWSVKQIFQIKKLEKGSYYTLYQVLPQ